MPAPRRKCSFRNCTKNSADYPGLKFFSFPKINYEEWVEACHLKECLSSDLTEKLNFSHFKKKAVCQLHFSRFDYTRVLYPFSTKLKRGAVPSIGKSNK